MNDANKKIRKISGKINIYGSLTCFLYLLMRDTDISLGQLEELVRIAEKKKEYQYSNGWLAKYSQYIAKRLK